MESECKFLADFASSITTDQSDCIYKCTTHVKSLRCDLKIDNNYQSVTITGVGRIAWRKYYFPKVTGALFMKYIQASESQLQSLQGETEAEVTAVKYVQDEQPQTTSVQMVFYNTPLI